MRSPPFLGRYWLCCRRSTAVIAGLVFSPDFWHLYDGEQTDDDDAVVDNSIFANTAKNIAFCNKLLAQIYVARREDNIFIYRCGHYSTSFFRLCARQRRQQRYHKFMLQTIFFTIFLLFICTPYIISYIRLIDISYIEFSSDSDFRMNDRAYRTLAYIYYMEFVHIFLW